MSTSTCAPVLVGTRLRGGTANSARGAASFTAEAITTARAAGATGLLIARMDSAFYGGAPIAACRRAGVRFSVTARMDTKITKAIAGIADHAWTPIKYPNAIFDENREPPRPTAATRSAMKRPSRSGRRRTQQEPPLRPSRRHPQRRMVSRTEEVDETRGGEHR